MQKKIAALSAFIFFITVVRLYAQTTVIIPSANTPVAAGAQNLTSYRKPLSAYFGYERSALIYKAAEIGASGSITSIGFYCDSAKAGIIASMPLKVYMKETTDTAFIVPTTVAAEESNSTLVYTGSLSAAQFVKNTFTTINLSTPFIYTGGTKNLELIIEINAGGTGGDASTSKAFRYHKDSTTYLFQYWQQDNNMPAGAGTLHYNRPNIQLNLVPSTACTTPPVAGNVIANDSSLCKGSVFSLLLSGNSTGAGQSYQWQASSDGNNWNNISGAVSSFYSAPLDSNTYYRCKVACSTDTVASTNVLLSVNPVTQCYCYTGLAGNCNAGNAIDSVSIAGTTLNNPHTGCSGNTALYYSIYPASGSTTCTLAAGQTYSMGVRLTGDDLVSMWIDYDQDGIFGTKEWVQICTSSTINTPVSASFTVPVAAKNGTTGLRIRSRATGTFNDSTCACSAFGSGETEDYTVTITGSQFGINNISGTQAEISIFPNPNNGLFTLTTAGLNHTTQVEIFNTNGQSVLREQYAGNTSKTIDLSAQPAGIYFVRLLNEGNAYTKKVIIR